MDQKVGRREIYSPVPPPSLMIPLREIMESRYRVIFLKKDLHFLEIANDDLNLYINVIL